MIYTYEQYANDIENNIILSNKWVKLAVERYRKFQSRDDIYFDVDAVHSVIDFIGLIKLFEGSGAGSQFKLEPWQQFILCNIYAWKWVHNNKRVTRDVFLFMSRKQGKSSFGAGIALNQILNDSENSPSVIMAGNSTFQAHQLLEKAQQFSHSLDPKQKILKVYRNEIRCKQNVGKLKIVSSDVKSIEGANASCFILDEYHQATDNSVLNSLRLSQGARLNPLAIIITTAGSNQFSPCKKLYETSTEILTGVKTDDSVFSMLYQLDEDDQWDDLNMLIKANPNLGVSKEKEVIEQEILKAKNNPSDESEIKTKVLNLWVSSSDVWLTNNLILSCTHNINIEDFKGQKCWVGIDLASTSDLCVISFMWLKDGIYYFKNNHYLPQSALTEHQQHEFYKRMYNQGDLILTAGNCTDYDYLLTDLLKVNQICPIQTVFFDSWNSTQFNISCTEAGLNMIPYSQSLANYNKPTKELERLIKTDKVVFDNNELIRFCFSNVILKFDHNQNCKPVKSNDKSKIDSVIASLTVLGGYLSTPKFNTNVYSF